MVWFRSSAPDWPYYTQCSTIPQIPLAKGSERVSGWRREMASNHRYPALRQVLYPAKLSLHDGGSSPPNSFTQTGSRRTESRRVPGAEEWFLCSLQRGSQPRVQHHSAATPTKSVLYPLRRFPVSFATDTGTFGYSQAQHLFADSFIGCPLAFDSGPHVDHAHQFNVVVYGDCDVWSK